MGVYIARWEEGLGLVVLAWIGYKKRDCGAVDEVLFFFPSLFTHCGQFLL